MYLPMTPHEFSDYYGTDICDIAIVSGDAYVDHPSFAAAIIGRVLEAEGFRVGIIAQPQNDDDWRVFGAPRLAFFICGGNLDSMVAHYTVAKKRRSVDSYSPGGRMGLRPDRALNVYCHTARRLFPKTPIVAGGIEASLRRFAHYDYWDDTVRPSSAVESGADLIIYGMGERASVEVAHRLDAGDDIKSITDIRGTVYAVPTSEYKAGPCSECASFEQVSERTAQGMKLYAKSCKIQQREQDAVRGKTVIQRHGSLIVVQNPPQPPLDGEDLDRVYELPYMRNWHPRYDSAGGVPAIEEVKFSIVHNRGCFGGCSFCAIAYHQGRTVTARTTESVLREARLLTKLPDFKGYIHDVGGPTANFSAPSCLKQLKCGVCPDRQCLAPEMCPAVRVDHSGYLDMLRRLREIEGVKRVFIRSGVRYDYLIADKDESFFKELVKYHVSGQLKVAPEHCCDSVLDCMGKPHYEVYERFKKRFYELTKAAGKEQYFVPYMISSHPGSTLRDAVELAARLKRDNMRPEQVQDFYPTPGTVSTCMFYTGIDPRNMTPVYVAREGSEKRKQRALLQYYRRENADIVRAALIEAGRQDLIGTGPECLVPPAKTYPSQRNYGAAKANNKMPGQNSNGKAKSAFDGKKQPKVSHKASQKSGGSKRHAK